MDSHNRHVRFTLPEATPDRDETPGTWMSHSDARTSVMMQVPNIGAFVRALLPVKLTGGFTVTFGVWLDVHPDDLHQAFRIWWEPEYLALTLDGRLAHVLPGWGLLASPVRAVVLNAEHTPYCVGSTDPQLAAVLGDEWPHDIVFDAIGASTSDT